MACFGKENSMFLVLEIPSPPKKKEKEKAVEQRQSDMQVWLKSVLLFLWSCGLYKMYL